jgi:DNA-binding NarL/FixJ family response regulator
MDSSNKQVVETTTKPTRELAAEIKAFCQLSRLTPRETEVVFVLAEGLVRIKEIAERLDLSPNTVNNHVNSIFVKTKTRSKSQLLSILLNRIAGDLYWARLMKQSPRILCIGESGQALQAAAALDRMRYRVSAATFAAATEASKAKGFGTPHFVLCELKRNEDPEQAMKRIREFTEAPVVFHSDTFDAELRCQAMDAGAIDLIKNDEPTVNLEALILGHFIEDETDRWNFLESKLASFGTQMVPSSTEESKPVTVLPDHCGAGGFFLPSGEIARVFKRDLTSGEWLEFPVLIGTSNQPIKVRGHVVWVRSASQVGRAAGAGVRLVFSDAKLSSFMTLGVSAKSSYIPAGMMA